MTDLLIVSKNFNELFTTCKENEVNASIERAKKSYREDFKVLKMMCNYWKVDLRTGFQMLSNYCVTGDGNNTI